MADGYQHLKRTADGPVATVTLARPQAHNALNAGLIRELADVFEALSGEDGIRVVVIAGEGRTFCAGADIEYMRDTAGFSYEENLDDARRLAEMYRSVDECPKPTVARVHGAAIGGGAGLTSVADYAVAEGETRFAFSEVRLGIAPATIAPFVTRKVGRSNARALFLTGERFTAERAREIGLVHEVVHEDALDAAVDRKVSELLEGGPEAQAATKGLLRRMEETEPMDAPGMTARLTAGLRTSAEGQEGLGAFLEKRPPRWRER